MGKNVEDLRQEAADLIDEHEAPGSWVASWIPASVLPHFIRHVKEMREHTEPEPQ